ncbi:hypothetical protein [Spirulina sp. 06S082]|uniref:hypothetical protein n=1 Tax=Spirulina sp. 06S082 TaxID=3110248 RepID=UPI002B1F6BED|nr:hypothetical protein [Spirulina sp. 06S082]MEA5472406.1 hypothetical protein [Spirulina sp. 06S082]
MLYKHTQIGVTILVILAIAALLMGVIALFISKEASIWSAIAVISSLAVIAILFGTLTVEVEAGKLRCWFGMGLIHKEFNLTEVTDVKIIKNPWFYGWGIRRVPDAWMFNVSGLDAVQMQFSSGRKFRIGTDEPRRLESAIRQNMHET